MMRVSDARPVRLAVAAVLGVLLLGVAVPALAQGVAEPPAPRGPIGAKQMFLMLFLMLGPIKILVPFVDMTRGLDAEARRALATRAILFAAAGLAIAGALGRSMLENFNMPTPVLALTGGLVLFLVALRTVLEQFSGTARARPAADHAPEALRRLAINPLAFPIIVTPYGIAATIVFTALAEEDAAARLTIALVLLAILVLDWLAMLFAHAILRWTATALQVLAVVLGVTQTAIGLQVMLRALAELGVIALRFP
ncbi:MarC family protein [Falsiroseomonas oryzae]|uniref:MarC family protein n=1 Tax=Falsiroseomonas oryzae TaxID=2766473 RepID=UPI0022EA80FA|nr:MarC family protein [Roseomonas sp. MO-31]